MCSSSNVSLPSVAWQTLFTIPVTGVLLLRAFPPLPRAAQVLLIPPGAALSCLLWPFHTALRLRVDQYPRISLSLHQHRAPYVSTVPTTWYFKCC